jgi:hypothetical protein
VLFRSSTSTADRVAGGLEIQLETVRSSLPSHQPNVYEQIPADVTHEWHRLERRDDDACCADSTKRGTAGDDDWGRPMLSSSSSPGFNTETYMIPPYDMQVAAQSEYAALQDYEHEYESPVERVVYENK